MRKIQHAGRVRSGVLASAVSALLGTAGTAGVAVAQQPTDPGQQEATTALEEIRVTGSRIVRRDYSSNSPIVTVDASDFETQTGLNIESYLNQLPNYNPATTPTTMQQDVQITPINSVGIASISLRGFGPNRSLVLVNGKRPVPINALMVTDINGVPSALVQRVETITGGASAVYGADAVAGVTNFILRDNYEGFEVDAQYGITEAGDGEESRISAVMGANLADGRGNVTLGMERYSRQAAFERNLDFFVNRWADPGVPGSFIFLQGINNYGCNFNCPNEATVDGMFSDRPEGTNVFNPFAGNAFREYNFNPDGTIFVGGSEGGLSRYTGPIDGRTYATLRALDGSRPPASIEFDSLKWNNTEAYRSAPQDRYSFFTSGNFEVTDRVTAFARATYAESQTRTRLFGTNAIGGWSAQIPYDPNTDSPVDPTLDYTDAALVADMVANPGAYANPNFIDTDQPGAHFPVPVELAILLNSRPNPTGEWQPNWNPDNSLPPRSTLNTNSVWQVEAGFNVDLPVRDWTAEFYVSRGESATYNVAAGNLSLQRYRTMITAPDYGRNAEIEGNQADQGSSDPGFGAASGSCTSGFYDTLFRGDVPLSDDCFQAISADLQTRTSNQQNVFELNMQGSVADLPGGELRAAVGYQYRDNSAQFTPDILQSKDSFTDQVVGVYPTGSLDASADVHDFYVEALVPLVSGVRGIERLELELGARHSIYEHTSDEFTWKALANWQVNDVVRFRGGYNRATRAPNLGELFLNPQEVFTGGGNFGDPCGIRSNSPFGAGGVVPDPGQVPGEPEPEMAPGQTAEGQQSAYLICQEMMGGQGSPGAVEFYEVSSAGPGGGGGFAWVDQVGNPNLNSEKADTWTFGFVLNSPWDNPWLAGLNLAMDWYKIDIDDAIMLYSMDHAQFRCFGEVIVSTQAEAAAQANSEACNLITRSQETGGQANTTLSFDNQATISTSGFDIALNWIGDLDDLFGVRGNLAFSTQATVLDYYRTKQSPAPYDVVTDWSGSLGPNLSGTNAGAYSYRIFTNMTYMRDSWNVGLRWRHQPSVWTAGYASQQAIIRNNEHVAAGGEGILLGYTPTTEIKTNSYNIFDLSANWNFNEMFSLRGGITNLFDVTPRLTGRSAGRAPGTDLTDECGGAPGCQNPTGYSLPGAGGVTAGYYDTLGRRFFMGLRARF